MTTSRFTRLLSITRRPAAPIIVMAAFALSVLALLAALRPWRTLEFSTWPSGFEAGRIARNLRTGLGYASPFLALPGDDFLTEEPHVGGANPGTAVPAVQPAEPGRWPTAWVAPPYVLMWVLPFALFGTYTAASAAAFQVLQVSLMTLALSLAWTLVRKAHGPDAALLALLFVALYPSTWYFALADTHGTALFVVLVLASLTTLGRVFEGGGAGARLAHGLAVALAILAEPSALLFYVWLELWAARRLRRITPAASDRGTDAAAAPAPAARRGALRAGRSLLAASTLACAVVIGPWAARNAVAFGTAIPFKSNLPMELFYGNNDEALHDSFLAHIHRFPGWSEEERLRLLEMGEPAYGRLCLGRVRDFVASNPWGALRLVGRRILYYWSYNPDRVTTIRPLLTVLFWLVLGSWAGANLLLRRRRIEPRWLDRACAGFFLLFPIAYYLTQFMLYRYRYPVEVLLLLATASSLVRAAETGAGEADRPTGRA